MAKQSKDGLGLDESPDSAVHTVYERIKVIKGYKMI